MKNESYVDLLSSESNKYIGCGEEELIARENLLLSSIEMDSQDLKKLQLQIQRLEQDLSKVREAKKYVNSIAIEKFICIEKKEKSKYVGSPDKHCAYTSSDFKSYVVYNFAVYQANAKDNTKARKIVLQSGDYTFDMKSNMMADMLKCIKQHNIKKVYLKDGVKIAEKQLEKAGVTIIK